MSTREQWDATWRQLGVAAPEGVYEQLVAAYAEPHRRYHTARHLDECFAALPALRSAAERPAEIELALWFHDAIYDTRRHDNEARSATWAREVVARAGLGADVGERVATLIMATRHDAVPAGADACVLVDIDLKILGEAPARFDEYERDVRAEYSWVPGAMFRRERRKIVKQLLEREVLYATPYMRESHEVRARGNLRRSLAALGPQRRAMPLALASGVIAIGALGVVSEGPIWIVFAVAGAVVLFYELQRP
jgi:predicted metal-dependent HD superfamily phosphohydrolase